MTLIITIEKRLWSGSKMVEWTAFAPKYRICVYTEKPRLGLIKLNEVKITFVPSKITHQSINLATFQYNFYCRLYIHKLFWIYYNRQWVNLMNIVTCNFCKYNNHFLNYVTKRSTMVDYLAFEKLAYSSIVVSR